jgi:nucleoside-diphosphate-sugar epimerase
VRELAARATHVVHMAAIAGVDKVLESPVRTMRVNLMGTFNVLEAAHAAGTIERLVDFSTSEVFGTHAYKVEETHVTSQGSVGEARWTYAVSKLAGEYMAHSYFDEFALPACSVRPFNIYGPGQIGSGAIHHFTVRALAGEEIVIHGDGSQIRAWCYVDDIVEALLLILEREEAVGQVFNVGNARSVVTVFDLAARIKRLAGSDSSGRSRGTGSGSPCRAWRLARETTLAASPSGRAGLTARPSAMTGRRAVLQKRAF